MWKRYKYIYYWLYSWNRDMWKDKSDLPEFNAVVGMSLSLACIAASLGVIVELITGIQLIPPGLPKKEVAITGIIILAIHYLVLVHNGRYKEIEKEFCNETKEERKRKGRWVLLYAFGSILFYIALLFFGIWMKN